MMKFAYQLKQELTENVKNKSNNVNTLKQLLLQSVKDLSKKREQFLCQFCEVYTSLQWLKLTKPVLQQDEIPTFYNTQNFSNFNESRLINLASYDLNINTRNISQKETSTPISKTKTSS